MVPITNQRDNDIHRNTTCPVVEQMTVLLVVSLIATLVAVAIDRGERR